MYVKIKNYTKLKKLEWCKVIRESGTGILQLYQSIFSASVDSFVSLAESPLHYVSGSKIYDFSFSLLQSHYPHNEICLSVL